LKVEKINKDHFALMGAFAKSFNDFDEKIIDGKAYRYNYERFIGLNYSKECYKTGNVIIQESVGDNVIEYTPTKNTFGGFFNVDINAVNGLLIANNEYDWLNVFGIDTVCFSKPSGYSCNHLWPKQISENDYINNGINLLNLYYGDLLSEHNASIETVGINDINYLNHVYIYVCSYGFNNSVIISLPIKDFLRLDLSKTKINTNWNRLNYGEKLLTNFCKTPEGLTDEIKLEILISEINNLKD